MYKQYLFSRSGLPKSSQKRLRSLRLWGKLHTTEMFTGQRASEANTVMKSGEHRYTLTKKEDVVAFEMEGAGVWDSLPCLIIKGICDYADCHKNKRWQRYAAMTAASCTKAFLEYWTLRARVNSRRKLSRGRCWATSPSYPLAISGYISTSNRRRCGCTSHGDACLRRGGSNTNTYNC